MLGNYVDDSRAIGDTMAPGTRFSREKKMFTWEELKSGEDCVRNSQDELLAALNSVVEGLKFTMEDFQDFQNNRLPTLYFALEISRGRLSYTFY